MDAAGLIRRSRALAGMSQSEVAAGAGTSQPAISKYESGVHSPTLETLERILNACGFTLRVRLGMRDVTDDDAHQIEENLRRSPDSRIAENTDVVRQFARLPMVRR